MTTRMKDLFLVSVFSICVMMTILSLGLLLDLHDKHVLKKNIALEREREEQILRYLDKLDEVTVPRAIFPIVALSVKEREIVFDRQGTGFLVGGGRLVVTALHVTDMEKHPHSSIHALISGKICGLDLVWEHESADIALLRPRCDEHPLYDIRPLTFNFKSPAPDEHLNLRGYQFTTESHKWGQCEHIAERNICPRISLMEVVAADVTLDQQGIKASDYQLKLIVKAIMQDPKRTAKEAEYKTYIISKLQGAQNGNPEYEGMSGSPLFDEEGHVRGVLTAYTSDRYVFIPAHAFPRELLE